MSQTLLCYLSASVLLAYGSYVDWHKRKVPYITIVGMALLGFYYRFYLAGNMLSAALYALLITLFIFLLVRLMQVFMRKPVLGYGDLQLFFGCLLWINLSQISLFFISTGVVGVLLAILHGRKRIPFVPAIAAGWAIAHLIFL